MVRVNVSERFPLARISSSTAAELKNAMDKKRTIHLVDDDAAVRRAVGFVLSTNGYSVQRYSSGTEFLKHADPSTTGCAMLDIGLPGMDGLEVQAMMAKRGIAMPVIVLTGCGDVSIAVRAMKAGAIDFLEKPFSSAALLQSVAGAFRRIDSFNLHTIEAAEASVRIAALTPREREVLAGLANGFPSKKIADMLRCSSRTVEVHRANITRKLGVRNHAEVLRLAFVSGINLSK